MNAVNPVGEAKRLETIFAMLDLDLLTWTLVEIFPVSTVLTHNAGKIQRNIP